MRQANSSSNTAFPSRVVDPVVALLSEHAAEMAAFEAGPGYDDDPHYARCVAIDEALTRTQAQSPAGAVASLQYLRGELLEFVLSDRDNIQAHLYLSLIDGAIGVVRKLS